jgi:hypothetical protein
MRMSRRQVVLSRRVGHGEQRADSRPISAGHNQFDRHALEGLWGDSKELGVKLKKLLTPFVWTKEQTTLRLRNRRS